MSPLSIYLIWFAFWYLLYGQLKYFPRMAFDILNLRLLGIGWVYCSYSRYKVKKANFVSCEKTTRN